MLKYVKTYQNNMPHSAAKLRPGQRLLCQIDFRVSSFVAVGTPWRFVSILISSALAYTDSEMELTLTCCYGFDCLSNWNAYGRVFDHFVSILISSALVKWNSLECVVLNLTGCYEQTVNVYFYLLFVFTSWWRALLTGRHFRR